METPAYIAMTIILAGLAMMAGYAYGKSVTMNKFQRMITGLNVKGVTIFVANSDVGKAMRVFGLTKKTKV